MQTKNTYPLFLALFATTSLATAQTSNLGELTIMPQTQMSVVDNFNNTPTASLMNDGELWVYAHVNNDGLLAYFDTANNGLTRFEGNTIQQLTGNALSEFSNITFNNTTPGETAIRINNSISIANEARFSAGIVNTSSGNMLFQNNAIATNASPQSFVEGLVYKQGSNAFVFPVGDAGNYREAAISNPNNPTATFSCIYYFEDPDSNYPRANKRETIDLVNATEYWIIENTSGKEAVFITLSWDDLVTSAAILEAPLSAIHVLRWNPTEALWDDLGGIVDTVNNTVTTLTTLSDYGVFTLGRIKTDALLPDGGVTYNLITTNNDGKNDYFIINNIQNLKNNQVEVYNRWGSRVFSTTNYDTNGNVFRGIQDKASALSNREYLPTGTYFYTLTYDHTENNTITRVKKTGFLYVNSD